MLSEIQTDAQKSAEINFRKKLSIQHTTGEMLLPDYVEKPLHDKILEDRIENTHNRMRELKHRGITNSPFIELGAERCQRSLVMVNDFNATGFAVDISYHQLATVSYFAKHFGRPKLPIRICCDIMNLPFKSNSVPFIFCYEFLHHFPKLRPVLEKINRILSEGYFFFDEEPFKNPRILLYKQKSKTHSINYQSRSKIRRFLEKYISDALHEEEDFGVLENHQITLSEWNKALEEFDSREVTISSIEKRIRTRMDRGFRPSHILNWFLGGEIEGLCKKDSFEKPTEYNDPLNLLTCPECLQNKVNNEPTLIHKENFLLCPDCKTTYPIVNEIFMLFRRNALIKLYPEFN